MAMATQEPITIQKTEQSAVEKLEHLLERGTPSLVTSTGEKVKLPGTVYAVLKRSVGTDGHEGLTDLAVA